MSAKCRTNPAGIFLPQIPPPDRGCAVAHSLCPLSAPLLPWDWFLALLEPVMMPFSPCYGFFGARSFPPSPHPTPIPSLLRSQPFRFAVPMVLTSMKVCTKESRTCSLELHSQHSHCVPHSQTPKYSRKKEIRASAWLLPKVKALKGLGRGRIHPSGVQRCPCRGEGFRSG